MTKIIRTDGRQITTAGVTFSGDPSVGYTDNPGKVAYFTNLDGYDVQGDDTAGDDETPAQPDPFDQSNGSQQGQLPPDFEPAVPEHADEAELPEVVPGKVDPDGPPAQYDAAMDTQTNTDGMLTEAVRDGEQGTPVQDKPERRAPRKGK